MKSPKVQILMSTYNGESYVAEQIESLLRQDYDNLEILIRDDGSTDSTPFILDRYANLNKVIVIKDKNIGYPQCFFELLRIASVEAEYFAFCDQDDVWLPDKVSRSIELLKEIPKDTPSMYCSLLKIVDENLNYLGISNIYPVKPSFNNAIVANIATGCTIVINQQAKYLVLKKIPSTAHAHDFWIYRVIAAFGEFIVDFDSKILYRQHSSNTIGSQNYQFFLKWKKRIERLIKGDNKYVGITNQIKEFSEIYSELLDQEKLDIINSFVYSRKTVLGRLKYMFWGEVHCQSTIDNLALRLLIFLNAI